MATQPSTKTKTKNKQALSEQHLLLRPVAPPDPPPLDGRASRPPRPAAVAGEPHAGKPTLKTGDEWVDGKSLFEKRLR